MKISLQRFLTIGLISLVLCGGLTATALWYGAREATASVEELKEDVESGVAGQQIQQTLAFHRRQALLTGLRSPEERRLQSALAKRKLIEDSQWLSHYSSTPQEKKIIEDIQTSISAYLQKFETLRDQGVTSAKLYESVSEQFYRTQEAIHELMSFNLAEAERLEHKASRQNGMNDLFVIFSLVLLFSAFGILLFGLRKFLYRPIIALVKTIENYELGNKIDVTPVTGANEIESISFSFQTLSSKLSKQKETQLTFLSAIAHDLKNPLSAIQMSTELIVEDPAISKSSKEILSVIGRQTGHMARLINDLLDTARVESGHLELEFRSRNILKIISDCVALNSQISSRHQIETNMPPTPIFVLCDEQRLNQVFNNLLNNAIKYSPNGGKIQIEVSRRSSQVVIQISDQGLGILPEDLAGIFEPFRRSKLTRNSIPGIGLGLSVSKKILEAHQGGDISVSSQPGVGTTFTIRLQSCEGISQQAAPLEH